ncbi:MAG: helix-turn-helix domain-containing protein [Actinomycetota bacterium]
MDDRQQRDDIRPVPFVPQGRPDLAVEVVDLVDVERRRRRVLPDETPERPDFECLLIVRAGTGRHTVDFQRIPLRSGRIVRVRAGQVQQWSAADGLRAWVVIARRSGGRPWLVGDPVFCDLDEGLRPVVDDLVAALVVAQQRPGTGPVGDGIWSALVGVFDLVADDRDRPLPEPYVAFRRAIELDPGRSRNVVDHIADLGWSERSIRRACLDVTGLTPKQLLDQRVVLEAKRLLAHTDRSAASIGAELGFVEATNFQKYFQRLAGVSPRAFRASLATVD